MAHFPVMHPAGHAMPQPKHQAQGFGGQSWTVQDVATKRFIALYPNGRSGVSDGSHGGICRPLFALACKAFSMVRGCSFTSNR